MSRRDPGRPRNTFLSWLCACFGIKTVPGNEPGNEPGLESERGPPPASSPRELLRFSLKDLTDATHNFSGNYFLGEGVFGEVFQGRLPIPGEDLPPAARSGRSGGGSGRNRAVVPSPDPSCNVAIKRMKDDAKRGINQFLNEVNLVGRVQCQNIAEVLGFCIQDGQVALVYRLYRQGSLDHHLFEDDMNEDGVVVARSESRRGHPALTWRQRMDVALGVSRALRHLHRKNIVHRDLKPSNILLDDNFMALVADFGLARSLDDSQSTTQTTTSRLDTLGYLDPAFATSCVLNTASDVYSLGVLLLELLTGKRAKAENLVNWVKHWRGDQELEALRDKMDQRLGGEFPIDAAASVAALARSCVSIYPRQRPIMNKVVKKLKEADTCT